MSGGDWLLDRADADVGLGRLLDSAARAGWAIGEISEPAQPFVAALLAGRFSGRVWIVCPDVRCQEDFATEMAAWCPRVRLFPELEMPAGDALPDPETASERLELLRALLRPGGSEVVVIHKAQWESHVPTKSVLAKEVFVLKTNQEIGIERVVARLEKAGYEPAPQVTARGQFARRGGILDVFSWQAPRPFRVEWLDEEIESLREFELDTQGSVEAVGAVEILVMKRGSEEAALRNFRDAGDAVIDVEPDEPPEGIFLGSGSLPDQAATIPFYPVPFAEFGAGDLILDEVKRSRFFDQLREWSAQGWEIAFACNNEGESERFWELAADFHFDASRLKFLPVPATRGFICPSAKLALLADAEILGRSASQRAHRAALRRDRVRSGRAAMDFSEFEEDDLVVHLDHGIGRFLGLQQAPDGGGEVLALEFAHDSKL